MTVFHVLLYQCCDIIVLNVHAPSEDKDVDIKDSFYEEIERLFDQVPIIIIIIIIMYH